MGSNGVALRRNLQARIEQIQQAAPAPAYQLRDDATIGPRHSTRALGQDLNLRVIAAHKGGFEAQLTGDLWRQANHEMLLPEPVTHALHGFARELDERDFQAQEVRPLSAVLLDLNSTLHGLPVLGPGGRLTAFQASDGVRVESSVRRRVQPVEQTGTWRQWSEIEDRLAPVIGLAELRNIEMTSRVDFGYVELGKRDRQSLLRPAYVVVIDAGGAGTVPWRAVFVEAATRVEGFELWDGLEPWREGGGGLDFSGGPTRALA